MKNLFYSLCSNYRFKH